MIDWALGIDPSLEEDETARHNSSYCMKLILLSNSVVQRFMFDMKKNPVRASLEKRKVSAMNLDSFDSQDQLQSEFASPQTREQEKRYIPTKFSRSKKEKEESDWWQDGVPVRKAKRATDEESAET